MKKASVKTGEKPAVIIPQAMRPKPWEANNNFDASWEYFQSIKSFQGKHLSWKNITKDELAHIAAAHDAILNKKGYRNGCLLTDEDTFDKWIKDALGEFGISKRTVYNWLAWYKKNDNEKPSKQLEKPIRGKELDKFLKINISDVKGHYEVKIYCLKTGSKYKQPVNYPSPKKQSLAKAS